MKKTILIYTERWCTGGIESLLANLVKNIDKTNFNVRILVSQKETNIYDKMLETSKIEEILEKKHKNPFIRIFNTMIRFKKNVKNRNIDVIHINLYNGVGMLYAYIAHRIGIKNIIVHAHNNGIDDDKFKIKYVLHILCKILFSRYANIYIACSKEAGKFCFNIPKNKKLVIINNGIDTRRFKYEEKVREQYKKELNIEGNFIIGNVARFAEQKNHDFLIDIFIELKQIIKEAKLLLIGNGILEERIKLKIKKCGIEKDVIILNERNDINNLMQVFDIFCLPSKYEGLGIVTIEAQACGVKCVISDGIPQSVMITPNIISIPLNETAKFWAEKIVEYKNVKLDKNVTKYIKIRGYDIKENTEKLEKIYLKY